MAFKNEPQPARTQISTQRKTLRRRLALFKLVAAALFISAVHVLLYDASRASTGAAPKSSGSKREPAAVQQPTAPERFDFLVREDFFAGMAGNRASFDRAMKVCEDALARNPKHAQAMVWHGSGLFFLAGRAFQAGDLNKGLDLRRRGEKEMTDAVALEPDVRTLIPRGSTYLQASMRASSPAQVKAMLEVGVADYERVLVLQKPYFSTLDLHARGELLWGLAEGWHRLNNIEKARNYFLRIVSECAGSSYAEKAQSWLDKKAPPGKESALSCTGCHAG